MSPIHIHYESERFEEDACCITASIALAISILEHGSPYHTLTLVTDIIKKAGEELEIGYEGHCYRIFDEDLAFNTAVVYYNNITRMRTGFALTNAFSEICNIEFIPDFVDNRYDLVQHVRYDGITEITLKNPNDPNDDWHSAILRKNDKDPFTLIYHDPYNNMPVLIEVSQLIRTGKLVPINGEIAEDVRGWIVDGSCIRIVKK